jgi:hypothetical protein
VSDESPQDFGGSLHSSQVEDPDRRQVSAKAVGAVRHRQPIAGRRQNWSVRRELRYVELKTGYGDSGPASIGWVTFSKTWQTVYYRDRVLRRIPGGGVSGNHRDAETGEEYWVSGVKRDGKDRHWAGSGPVEIDEDALEAYEMLMRRRPRAPKSSTQTGQPSPSESRQIRPMRP